MSTDPTPKTPENRQSVFLQDSVSAAALDHAPMIEGLSDRQSRFVWAYLLTEGNAAQSAELAGYGAGAKNGIGLRNLAKAKVQKAIADRVKLNTGVALAKAMSAALRIIETGKDERAIVAAAFGLMDRCGMAPPRGPTVAVQINNSIGSSEAQSILADVQRARQARLGHLSDIPPAMTDRSATDAADAIDGLERLAADGMGGVHLQGSPARLSAITPQPCDGRAVGVVLEHVAFDPVAVPVRRSPASEGMFD